MYFFHQRLEDSKVDTLQSGDAKPPPPAPLAGSSPVNLTCVSLSMAVARKSMNSPATIPECQWPAVGVETGKLVEQYCNCGTQHKRVGGYEWMFSFFS